MKKKILLLLCAFTMCGHCFAQNMITDKGYFYSPDGFTCKGGSLYTADMKTMIKKGYYSSTTRNPYEYEEDREVILIPEGAEIIPSNLIIHTATDELWGQHVDARYYVFIPSSVKYIATNAFMFRYISFFNLEQEPDQESSVKSSQEKTTIRREVSRYNIKGQKIEGKEKGINIVKMLDETAYKEIVK